MTVSAAASKFYMILLKLSCYALKNQPSIIISISFLVIAQQLLINHIYYPKIQIEIIIVYISFIFYIAFIACPYIKILISSW